MEERPRQRDADRSRAAILDAAERLFAADGLQAVTMAQIGAAAGVSRGTPGYFFGSKEALYRTVVTRAAATLTMLAATLRVRDAAGPRDRDAVVGDTVDAFLSLLTSRRSIVALLDREAGTLETQPHAVALRDALGSLGPEAGETALAVLSLCWFPLSQPRAAAALGLDPDAPGFAAELRGRVVAAAAPAPEDPTPVAATAGEAPRPEKKKKKKKRKA